MHDSSVLYCLTISAFVFNKRGWKLFTLICRAFVVLCFVALNLVGDYLLLCNQISVKIGLKIVDNTKNHFSLGKNAGSVWAERSWHLGRTPLPFLSYRFAVRCKSLCDKYFVGLPNTPCFFDRKMLCRFCSVYEARRNSDFNILLV